MKKPTKAIIAAAGFGTRFLPQTKAMPKEMLPLIDKPIIQYVVEELVEAGIKDIIIIGSANKRAIEDHFDTPNEELVKLTRRPTWRVSVAICYRASSSVISSGLAMTLVAAANSLSSRLCKR